MALLELSQKVKRLLDTKIVLPYNSLTVEVQPVAIMKAVIGHLMAASKLSTDTWLDESGRKCVLDENKPVPDDLHVYYWFYPYPEYASVHRDFAIPSVRGMISSKAEVFATMKYFPVAFLVTKLPSYAHLSNLDKWRNELVSTKAVIPINLAEGLPKEWPDMADNGNFVMVGEPIEYSIVARPRIKSNY